MSNLLRLGRRCVLVVEPVRRRKGVRATANQRACGYQPGEFDMAKSCLQVAPCRHIRSKQAARNVDDVSVLDIFWVDRLAMNTGPKINGFSKLHSVDDTSQMNIARASVVPHATRFHDRLIHSRRAIKRDCSWFIGES